MRIGAYNLFSQISLSLSNIHMSGVGGHTWRDRSCKWRRSRKRDVDEPYNTALSDYSYCIFSKKVVQSRVALTHFIYYKVVGMFRYGN